MFLIMIMSYLIIEIPLQKQRVHIVTQKIVTFLSIVSNNHVKPLANEIFEQRERAMQLRLKNLLAIDGIIYTGIFNKNMEKITELNDPLQDNNTAVSNFKTDFKTMAESKISHIIKANDLYFIKPVTIDKELFGYLIIKFQLHDIKQSHISDVRKLAATVFAAMAIVFFIINFLIKKTVVAPVMELQKKIKALEKSQSTEQISNIAHDEIGDLALSFNNMSQKISDSYARIGKKNSELVKLKTFMENILDKTPDVIFRMDKKNKITFINDAIRRFGYDPQDLIGMNPMELILPQDKKNVLELMEYTEKFIDLKGFEMRLATGPKHIKKNVGNQDNKTISTLIVDIEALFSSPARSSASFIGSQGIARDISNHVRIQNIMVQTEKMMAVGGLAAGMAHEINNPLAIILQSNQNIIRRLETDFEQNVNEASNLGIDLEALQSYLKNRSIYRYLKNIKDAGGRAARIVRSMLDFSRAGESEKTMCNISEMIDDAVEMASRDYDTKKKYDFKNIIIKRTYSDMKPVLCTKSEIIQVLLNILKNAAQAMVENKLLKKEPLIKIKTSHEKKKYRIEIEDNGPGIDPKNQKSIFEPFFTTKSPGQGTGLGLSISYFIITSHHRGKLWVESQQHKGCKFIIELPEH
ncbi:MAG: PAS domain S-box protein, partial [Desulfobacula sp.]|nr:PAS domain S-box protein [Desulfobacula sp.]